ncbi:MAG: response regulator [Holophagales bacterium]|jgi:putative two-component system response regulator|nr:response regulator [Holophagales bacterium]
MDNKRAIVMVVDDNIANLMVAKNALAQFYNVFTMSSAAKMFSLLERNKPDLILLDMDMPEMDGFEAVKILKAKPDTRNIPVIFLTAKEDAESELESLILGAIDYISKPFMPQLLHKRVELHLTVEAQKLRLEHQAEELEARVMEVKHLNENLQKMVEEKTNNILKLQSAIFRSMANLVESRDDVTGKHIERTQRVLKVLMQKLREDSPYQDQVQGWDVGLMLESSQLHDLGKIAISDNILKKPGLLTAEEFEEIKKHVEFGIKIIELMKTEVPDADLLKYAKIFAETHHEKWDGSGYPNGLSGENIPLLGRLMAVADVYDALISERPYKKALPHEEAVQIILKERGSHFDPVLVDVFEQVADQFAIPTYFLLKP